MKNRVVASVDSISSIDVRTDEVALTFVVAEGVGLVR